MHDICDEHFHGIFDDSEKVLVGDPIWDIGLDFLDELEVRYVDLIIDYLIIIDNSSNLNNMWILEENSKDFLIDVKKAKNDEVMVSYQAKLEGETHL